jgi:predicted GNAT family acetyltransferase
MAEVKLNIQKGEPSAFELYDEGEKYGEMVFDIDGENLTVYHTEIDPEKEGKGYAKLLLEAMVDYVRKNNLKVIPLCPYVHLQFRRHEELYKDIWNKVREND